MHDTNPHLIYIVHADAYASTRLVTCSSSPLLNYSTQTEFQALSQGRRCTSEKKNHWRWHIVRKCAENYVEEKCHLNKLKSELASPIQFLKIKISLKKDLNGKKIFNEFIKSPWSKNTGQRALLTDLRCFLRASYMKGGTILVCDKEAENLSSCFSFLFFFHSFNHAKDDHETYAEKKDSIQVTNLLI